MSTNSTQYLQSLPVEILHRIFDSLDAQTILFSLRRVCRLLRAVVNTYDRYVLNFESISKPDFHLICRLIHPQHVISITFARDNQIPGQIDLFLSLVRIRQFTRLRSLTLPEIDEFQLNIILKRINITSLTSLSLNIQKYDDRRTKTTVNLISSVLVQPNLRKLDLHIKEDRLRRISWPNNCTVRHFTVNEHMTFDYMCTLFRYSPHLHTLVVKQSLEDMTKDMVSTPSLQTSFRQLTSLTLERMDIKIDKLEALLLLTPSLVYLKLINNESLLDGKRWEQFVQANLPFLDKFEFYSYDWSIDQSNPRDIKPIIAPFQTPFWLEYKKWFVLCEHTIGYSDRILLYSIPLSKYSLQYQPNLLATSISTSTVILANDPSVMDNVDTLSLAMTEAIAGSIERKRLTTSGPLFRKATKLELDLTRDWLPNSLQSLSKLIDLSQLVQIKLDSYHFGEYNRDTLTDIAAFIQRACNVSSLIFYSGSFRYKSLLAVENICSMVPHHVKHLQVTVKNLDGVKMILEGCQHLSSVQFDVQYSKFAEQIVQWLAKNTMNSTYRKSFRTLTVWLGRIKIELNDVTADHKRIKLTDGN